MRDYLQALEHGVVAFDGATGTQLQARQLSAADFGGAGLEGCNENLIITRPDVVSDLHVSYLEAGADVIETNTFGAFAVVLEEYGIADRTRDINLRAAALARELCDRYSSEDQPRFAAGSMGPGTKLPSLGQIEFDTLQAAYEEQAAGLIEGGVDLVIIETVYDLLQAKAAVMAARAAMESTGRQVPIQLQVTMETTGRMLIGSEIGAALTALGALEPDVFGLNCATGPREMSEHLRHLSQYCRVPIACMPNAGLPSVVDGRTHYDLSPEELLEHQTRFITEFGVSVVGGCCGTTPAHIQLLAEHCRSLAPSVRSARSEPSVSSAYSAVPIKQDTSFLVIGERTNANGSKRFREAMLEGDWDTCERMAREQVAEGAHVLDLCVDYVGRDGRADMREMAARLATSASAPLVIDSTEPEVMEVALKKIGGRSILNSANLEDGEGAGSRFDRVARLARRYGAAVICLLIDEQGQARDLEWKLRVARRIQALATTKYGLRTEDLIFDALTFPLSTGDDDLRRDAMETIEAIKGIKREFPDAATVLGISNVSFGLKPAARHVLNSVFLHECLEAGLDAAIVHAGTIVPLNRIEPEHVRICTDLIYDRRTEGRDPLQELLAAFEGVESVKVVEDRSGWPVEERLKQRVIDGDRNGIEDDLVEALTKSPALYIVNDVLLDGMKVVGELFASGEMQLPFVLQSAQTMKTAVAFLEPHMEKADQGGKGKVVLATVKGDVHDIGKNLVDIILTNNGYEVHNLGIKVGITEMIDKAREIAADAIGMSGLLVKSTLIMKDNLEELNNRGLDDIAVVLGGAALTRTYVERDLRDVYKGRLFYGRDAFEGLGVMDRLVELKKTGTDDPDFGRVTGGRTLPPRRLRAVADPATLPGRSPEVDSDNEIFVPPFLGTRVIRGVLLDEIDAYVNETALYRNQWGFRPTSGETDAQFKERIRSVRREQLANAKATGVLVPQVVYGYFACNARGNSLIIWDGASRSSELCKFEFPRQAEHPYLCIADFFRSEEDEPDYAAFHIATMGTAVSEKAARLFKEDRYQEYLLLHGLGVEMTEALAELWHRRIREEWGFAAEDGPTLTGLFRQQYRGGRYSWGYPACPNLEDNQTVASLLQAERIGVSVSEGFQLHPEQTTSAIICHHPQAKYFIA